MTDWFKKISAIITTKEESEADITEQVHLNNTEKSKHKDLTSPLFSKSVSSRSQATEPTQRVGFKEKGSFSLPKSAAAPKKEEHTMVNIDEQSDNLKALKRLRDLPRGTQVDSRIAAIENLLGESEIFKTLKMLRWPQGVICPECHSTNVIRREPPPDATDKRHYYVCLNCKGDGSPSDFDDFTGLPLKSMFALRQWILCWYLIGFCSVAQIAKVLGISAQEVIQIASLGTEITELPDAEASLEASEKKAEARDKHKKTVEEQEDYTRSESKAPLKPGFKSKK